MKKGINYLTICLFACCMSSCLTSKQKIVINGTPGTEIYYPNDELNKIGTIGVDGQTKIKISRDGYYPYLLAYHPNTGRFYPFGIDYKYRKSAALDWTIFTVSMFPPISLWSFGCSGYFCSQQYNDGFRYLKEQTINPNTPNATYANIGMRREIKGGTLISEEKATPSFTTSKLLRKDYAKQLQGTYTGNGRLLKGDNAVETYSNMKILMTRMDRNTVTVEIFMDGNEAIFASCNYSIKNEGIDYFVLISEKERSAKIEIKGSNVTYNNPNVNIDGDIYELQITASNE